METFRVESHHGTGGLEPARPEGHPILSPYPGLG